MQHPAHKRDRIMEPQPSHEHVPDVGSFAKYAAAFFKKSRSIFNSATSRLRRATFLCSSLIGFPWLPTFARVPSLVAHTQYVMVDFGINNLRATSGAFKPPSVIILTASSRSSLVYIALGILSMFLAPLFLYCTSTLVSTKSIIAHRKKANACL